MQKIISLFKRDYGGTRLVYKAAFIQGQMAKSHCARSATRVSGNRMTKTMDEAYGDGATECTCCDKCGYCIEHGDCAKYGCGRTEAKGGTE